MEGKRKDKLRKGFRYFFFLFNRFSDDKLVALDHESERQDYFPISPTPVGITSSRSTMLIFLFSKKPRNNFKSPSASIHVSPPISNARQREKNTKGLTVCYDHVKVISERKIRTCREKGRKRKRQEISKEIYLKMLIERDNQPIIQFFLNFEEKQKRKAKICYSVFVKAGEKRCDVSQWKRYRVARSVLQLQLESLSHSYFHL